MTDNPKCVNCGRIFTRVSPKQTFCTLYCNQIHKKNKKNEIVVLNCESCSKNYEIKKRNLNIIKNKSLCHDCRINVIMAERPSVRQCLRCGIEFRSLPTIAKFCSDKCASESRLQPLVKFAKENHAGLSNKQIKNIMPCANCAFGKKSSYSETGWECLANARVCGPFTSKKLFKQK